MKDGLAFVTSCDDMVDRTRDSQTQRHGYRRGSSPDHESRGERADAADEFSPRFWFLGRRLKWCRPGRKISYEHEQIRVFPTMGASDDLFYADCVPPHLSVIITAYDEGEELHRTVNSVRANTRQSHEIIVVDDGSTDAAKSTLASGTRSNGPSTNTTAVRKATGAWVI